MWSCAWSNKRVKSCYCACARLHTDQGNLRRGQPVQSALQVLLKSDILPDYYYYYFIFASQHDPLAPLSREGFQGLQLL
jgi:hypothetical protein